MTRLEHPLEELFRGSRKTLRILRALALAEAPLTKYGIESRAAVYDAGSALKRLERLGIVRSLDGKPKRYVLNRSNPLARALLDFLQEAGYL